MNTNQTPNNEKNIRGFYRFSKAWYATSKDIAKPTIMIGMYDPKGGTTGEISITWEELERKKVPRLKAFDDGWKVLASFTDLLKKMADWDNKNITEDQFVQLLEETGFTDLTPYKQNLKAGQHDRVVVTSHKGGRRYRNI